MPDNLTTDDLRTAGAVDAAASMVAGDFALASVGGVSRRVSRSAMQAWLGATLVDNNVAQASVILRVPSDYSTIQGALTAVGALKVLNGAIVEIRVEDGYQIASGVTLDGGDYSHIRITKPDGGPLTPTLNFPDNDNFFTFKNCTTPNIGLLLDCDGKGRNGFWLENAWANAYPECGVENAGINEGAEEPNGCGFFVWKGSSLQSVPSTGPLTGIIARNCARRGVDVTHNSFASIVAADLTGNGSSLVIADGHAALFASRASTVQADNADFSGSIRGIRNARSWVSAREANFDACGEAVWTFEAGRTVVAASTFIGAGNADTGVLFIQGANATRPQGGGEIVAESSDFTDAVGDIAVIIGGNGFINLDDSVADNIGARVARVGGGGRVFASRMTGTAPGGTPVTVSATNTVNELVLVSDASRFEATGVILDGSDGAVNYIINATESGEAHIRGAILSGTVTRNLNAEDIGSTIYCKGITNDDGEYYPEVYGKNTQVLYVAPAATGSGDASDEPSPLKKALNRVREQMFARSTFKYVVQLEAGTYTIDETFLDFDNWPSITNVTIMGPDVSGGTPTAILNNTGTGYFAFKGDNFGPYINFTLRDLKFTGWNSTKKPLDLNRCYLSTFNVHSDNAAGLLALRSGFFEIRGSLTASPTVIENFGSSIGIIIQDGYGQIGDPPSVNGTGAFEFDGTGVGIQWSRGAIGYIRSCTFTAADFCIDMNRLSRLRTVNNAPQAGVTGGFIRMDNSCQWNNDTDDPDIFTGLSTGVPVMSPNNAAARGVSWLTSGQEYYPHRQLQSSLVIPSNASAVQTLSAGAASADANPIRLPEWFWRRAGAAVRGWLEFDVSSGNSFFLEVTIQGAAGSGNVLGSITVPVVGSGVKRWRISFDMTSGGEGNAGRYWFERRCVANPTQSDITMGATPSASGSAFVGLGSGDFAWRFYMTQTDTAGTVTLARFYTEACP